MIARCLLAKLFPAAAGLVLLLGTSGCRQGENDRCQIDSDCQDGLYCELAGNSRAQGGFCRQINPTTADQSVSQDLPPPAADLGDMAPAGDLGPDLPSADIQPSG